MTRVVTLTIVWGIASTQYSQHWARVEVQSLGRAGNRTLTGSLGPSLRSGMSWLPLAKVKDKILNIDKGSQSSWSW